MIKFYNDKDISETIVRVSKLLKEEYSISDRVKTEALALKNVILKGIRDAGNYAITICENPLITLRHGKIKTIIMGNKGIIHFQCYNFQDANAYNKYKNKVPHRIKNQYAYKSNVLDISIDAINGKIIPQTFVDSIQHEMEHAYQENEIGVSYADKGLYTIARDFRDPKNTEEKQNIGEFLYITYQAEQDAYVNGLYALLVHNYQTAKSLTSVVFRNSDVFGVIERIIELKKYFKENGSNPNLKSAVQDLRRVSHIGYSRLLTMADETVNRLCAKIARVIYKAQKDTNYYNDMEYVDYNGFKKLVTDEVLKLMNESIN